MTDIEKYSWVRTAPRHRLKLEEDEYSVLAEGDGIVVIDLRERQAMPPIEQIEKNKHLIVGAQRVIGRMHRDYSKSVSRTSDYLSTIDEFEFVGEEPSLPESRTAAEIEMERDAELAQLEANGTLPSHNERLKRANDLLTLIGRHDPA